MEDQVSTLDLLTTHFEVSNERQRQRPIIYPVVIIMKKCHNKCTLNDAKKTIQVVLNQREKILENKETAKNTQKIQFVLPPPRWKRKKSNEDDEH